MKVRWLPRTLLPLSIAAVASAPGAQGRLWTVSASPCAGTDFQQIQPAIDQAGDGDVIVLFPVADIGGYGAFEVNGKALTLLPAPGTRPVETGTVTVRNLGPDQAVALSGLRTPHLEVFDCQGPVWVEDSEIDQLGAEVSDSLSVALLRSSFQGRNVVIPPFVVGGYTPGGDGLRVTDSAVHVYDCVLAGGHGGLAIEIGGSPGGAGIRLSGSSLLFASGSSLTGGMGGDGNPPVAQPGPGGNGLTLEAGILGAAVLDCELKGASEGGGTGFPQIVSKDVGGVNDHLLVTLQGTARSYGLVGLGPVAEGSSLQSKIQGEADDMVFFGLSFEQKHVYYEPYGSLLLDLTTDDISLDTLPASGQLDKELQVLPDLVPPGFALVAYTQLGMISSAGMDVLAPGKLVVAVDASFASIGPCP